MGPHWDPDPHIENHWFRASQNPSQGASWAAIVMPHGVGLNTQVHIHDVGRHMDDGVTPNQQPEEDT